MTTEQKAQAYDEALERAKMYQGMLMLNLEDAAREYVRTAPHADIGLRPIPFNVNIKDLYNRVDIKRAFKAGAQWQKEHVDKETIKLAEDHAYFAGSENTRKNLWHPADGDDLPEIDREVIVLLTNGKVCFAHRPNPDGWDGKSITTGEVKHYDVQTYDNGGWNIPDVKYWLDAPIPQEGGEE